jgi:hypothetical protein
MGGNTGNLRTFRNQSGVNGSRTFGSILASDAVNGAGSARRVFQWYANHNPRGISPFTLAFGITYGEARDRTQFLLGNQHVF